MDFKHENILRHIIFVARYSLERIINWHKNNKFKAKKELLLLDIMIF